MFGVFRPRKSLTNKLYHQIKKIARANESDLTGGNIPGTGLQYWFVCQNRGNPFDQQTAKITLSALENNGIFIKEL